MDLKITTGSAQAALAQVTTSIDHLRTTLTSLAQNKSLDNIAAKMASMTGVNPAIVQQINALNTAIGNLNQTAGGSNLTSLGNQMNNLSRQLAGVQGASNGAANGVGNVGNQARAATSGVSGMGTAVSRLNGVLGLLGVGLSAASFASFLSGSLEALRTVQKFEVQMKTLGGPAFAAKQMEFLNAVANETGQSLEVLVKTYGGFSQAAIYAGVSTQDTAKMFYEASTAFRTFGLSAEDAKGAFKAIEQMLTKQQVMMEELKGQLGERLPAAMSAMAKAAGTTVAGMQEMAKHGQLTTQHVKLFTAALYEMSKTGLAASLLTYEAALARFSTAVFKLQIIVGNNFFDAFKSGLNAVAVALQNPQVDNFIAKLSALAGFIVGGLGFAFASFLQFLGFINIGLEMLGAALAYAGGYVVQFGNWLNSIVFQMTGWQFSIAGITQALQFLVPVISVVAGAFIAWLAISAIMATITASMGAFRLLMVFLASSSAIMAAKIILAVAALTAFAAALLWVSDRLGFTKGAFDGFVNSVDSAIGKALDLAKALPDATAEIGATGGAMQKTAGHAGELANGMTGVAQAVGSSLPVWGYTTEAVSKYRSEMDQAAQANDRIIDKMALSYANALNAANGYSTAATSLDELAMSYNNAAGAAERMASASSSASSGSGRSTQPTGGAPKTWATNSKWSFGDYAEGRPIDSEFFTNDFGESNLFKSGGISHLGGVDGSASLPSSAWANAPHYADGTANTTGGGIPSILHPNEAVIPLSGGRSVPVELSTGGGGPTSGGGANLTALLNIKQSLDVINASTITNGVTAKTDTDRLYQRLIEIHATLMGIRSAIGTVGSSGGSSGGGSTGGGTSSPSTPSAPAASADEDPRFPGLTGIALRTAQIMNSTHDKWSGNWKFGGEDGKLTTEDFQGNGSFAGGSPNASRDMSGGFIAQLHPDEAVIPLPDGRSVPVKLQGGGDNLRAQSGGNTFNVSVAIHAKDAQSFAKSEDQIAQQLQRALERAARNIGTAPQVEDPTVRAT